MPTTADTVQQWSAETVRALAEGAVADGLVGAPARDVTLLYGRPGALAPNAYLRAAGNVTTNPAVGYPVPAGAKLTRLRVYFAANADLPGNTLRLIVEVNGAGVFTLEWAGETGRPPVAFDLPLAVVVADSAGGLGRVAIRSGAYTNTGDRPTVPLVQITAELAP
jgi:hypothetical protein